MAAGTAGVSVLIQLPVTGWVDITSYVRLNDGNGITITAGCSDETTAVGMAECSMVVDNSDGRFSIHNPNGTWWGKIALGLTLRVTTTAVNGSSHDRFWGKVNGLSPGHDQTGTIREATLSAAGESYFLKSQKPPISAYKGMVRGASAAPVAYCTLEGQPVSLTAGYTPTIGNYSAVPSDEIEVAAESSVPGSGPLPVIHAGGCISLNVGPYTNTGTTIYRQIINVADGGPSTTCVLFQESFTGGTIATWQLMALPNGILTSRAYNYAGTEVLADSAWAFNFDGTPAQIWLEQVQSGANIAWRYGTTNVAADGTQTSVLISAALASHTLGRVTNIKIAPGLNVDDVAVGHMTLGNSTSVAPVGWAVGGYAGEKAENRVDRTAGIFGVAINKHASTFFDEYVGPQPVGTFIDILQDIADSNGGILADSTSVLGIDYFSRHHMHYSDVVMTLDVDSGHVRLPPQPVCDDKDVVWAAEVSGARYESEVTTFGAAVSKNANLALSTASQAAAEWEVHMGENATMRLSSITIDLVGNTSLRGAWLAIYPGDRVRITSPPDDYPRSGDLDFILRGWSEYISYHDWDVVMNLTSADPWNVGLLETYGALLDDTETGTIVNGFHTDNDTTILITTSAPGMSTANTPFDMLAATGERFTVNSITTHSTTSYTLNVTRSVNGVVKTLPASTAIWLAEPFILAR